MRLLNYIHDNIATFGIVSNDGVIDLGARLKGIANVDRLLLEHSDLRAIQDLYGDAPADAELSEIQYRPPVQNPSKIICVGLNYRGHMTETGRAPVDHPTLFARWPDSHVGHNEPIIRPKASELYDFEGEVAVVVGKQGRHIPTESALSYIAGFSCYNDGSIRDWQRHTTQWLPGKNFIASGAFGPWLVTADEVPDPASLELTTRLNGEVVQNARLSQLIFDLPTLISYISTFTELNAGDVIATGTPDGVGAFRDPPVSLKAGDTVEVEVTRIGSLSNTVVDDGE